MAQRDSVHDVSYSEVGDRTEHEPQSVRDYCAPVEMVATGTPHDGILRLATSLRADLIVVMGTGSRSAAEVMLLGSTTDPVLRQALCPVLTIGAHA